MCPRFVQASVIRKRMSSVCPRLCVRWAMYTVGRVAELTGIPPDTLRMWERRYDVVEPGPQRGRLPALRRAVARRRADERPRGRRVVSRAGGGTGARRRRRRLGAAPGGGRRLRRRRRPRAGRGGVRPGRPRPGARPRLLVRDLTDVVDGWLLPALHASAPPGVTGESASRASTSSAPPCTGGSPRRSTRSPTRPMPPGSWSAWRAVRATSSASWPSPPCSGAPARRGLRRRRPATRELGGVGRRRVPPRSSSASPPPTTSPPCGRWRRCSPPGPDVEVFLGGPHQDRVHRRAPLGHASGRLRPASRTGQVSRRSR